MRFASWTFWWAGWYGLLVIVPQYFLEQQIAIQQPPAITHPEYFYGFVGVAAAWQVAFLIIARDPVRFRPVMLAGVLEKASFGFAAIALYAQQRLASSVLAFALFDLVLGVLFLESFRRTRTGSQTAP